MNLSCMKKENIFILDLSEEEISARINEKVWESSTIGLLDCTAGIKNFNQSIYYAEWNSSYWRPYTYAFYYNDVRTWVDDDKYICDVELWYYHYYQNVWAVTAASRFVITSMYNWKLSRRYVWPDWINTLVIGFKAILWWQTPQSLYQNVVLW
jgi:hypothetical protein